MSNTEGKAAINPEEGRIEGSHPNPRQKQTDHTHTQHCVKVEDIRNSIKYPTNVYSMLA